MPLFAFGYFDLASRFRRNRRNRTIDILSYIHFVIVYSNFVCVLCVFGTISQLKTMGI